MLIITAHLPRCKRIFSLQQRDQPLDIRLLRCPAGRDAHDGLILAALFPKPHDDVRGEAGELRRVEREEDLIRRCVSGEAVILRRERRADAVCHGDAVRTAALVEPIRKERIELDAGRVHGPLREARRSA